MAGGTEAPPVASAGQVAAATLSAAELLEEAGALERSGSMQGAVNLIHLAVAAGRIAPARRTYSDALALGGADEPLRARIEQHLGILANIQGDLDGALLHYEHSLEAYRRTGDLGGQGLAFHNLGMMSADREWWDDADRYFTESAAIARRLGDGHLEALCRLNHSEVHLARQRYDLAMTSAEQALQAFERQGSALDKADAYRAIGMVYRETGRLALAEARLDLVDVTGRREKLEATYQVVVRGWGQSIESSDSYTFGHCERVAGYAVGVAQALGLDEATQTTIRLGAYLHDVGKIRVPHEILNKPGRLTPREFDTIKQHPRWGVELLANVEFPWDLKPIIRWHHEKHDGTGYPDGLRGDAIPLSAQILCVVDVYDALTTTRSYRPALTHEAAVAQLLECRSWWRPDVFGRFLDAVSGPLG